MQLHSDDYSLDVGQVTDDPFDGFRQPSNERRDRDDLVTLCELGVLREIDHLDEIPARQTLFAKPFEICESGNGSWSLASDIEAQIPTVPLR